MKNLSIGKSTRGFSLPILLAKKYRRQKSENRNQKTEVRKICPLSFGFTLIEMMVVLVIISIITATTLPYFFSFYTGQELKTSARIVASVLRTAKGYAAAKNTDCWVQFTPSNNKLDMAVYHADIFDEDGNGNVVEPVQQGKTEKLQLSSNVIFSTTFTNKKITFTPQGTADYGTTNDEETVTINNTGKNKKIDVTVSEATARIKVGNIY